MPGVSSVQITFHEDKAPEHHAMPPGGFRLAIVNATSLEAGRAGREKLWAARRPLTRFSRAFGMAATGREMSDYLRSRFGKRHCQAHERPRSSDAYAGCTPNISNCHPAAVSGNTLIERRTPIW